MVDSTFLRANTEGNRMVAVIAMHEDGCDYSIADFNLVLDPASHPKRHIEAASSVNIILTYDAVADPASAGFEPSMHPPTRVERLDEFALRPVKDLNWISTWIIELHHLEHTSLGSFVR